MNESYKCTVTRSLYIVAHDVKYGFHVKVASYEKQSCENLKSFWTSDPVLRLVTPLQSVIRWYIRQIVITSSSRSLRNCTNSRRYRFVPIESLSPVSCHYYCKLSTRELHSSFGLAVFHDISFSTVHLWNQEHELPWSHFSGG